METEEGQTIVSRWLGGRARLALLASLLLTLLVTASALAGKQSLDVDVTTCDEDGCETQEQEVPAQTGGGGGSKPGGGGERHEVDLGSGSSHSTDSSGGESVTLDLGSKGRGKKGAQDLAPVDLAGGGKTGGARPDRAAPDVGAGIGRLDVSTSGGKFDPGSAFDFVSADQALSSFAIPPFLLPIYVSAGRAYDVPWNVLASINQIETDFGRLGACAVSYAGAQGWMQFMPGTWAAYGVDASGDGVADPCNPVDAIYAAARYLDASGASTDLRSAVFAYNHADWYVDRVLATAGIYGSLPAGLVGETGSIAFGHFPVSGPVRYGDDFRSAEAAGEDPTGLQIFPRGGRARAVATQDVTVAKVLVGPSLASGLRSGKESVLQQLSPYRRPGSGALTTGSSFFESVRAAVAQATGIEPLGELTAGLAAPPLEALGALADAGPSDPPAKQETGEGAAAKASASGTDVETLRVSTPADESEHPGEPGRASKGRGPDSNGAGADRREDDGLPAGFEAVEEPGIGIELRDALGNRYRYSGLRSLSEGLRPDAKVGAADSVGKLRTAPEGEGKPLVFETVAAGGAAVDPRPLIDGYRLQETADFYHAVKPFEGNPFVPTGGATATGSVEGSQEELARRVLADSGISIYECGRQDVAKGIVDKRILGALLYLRRNGLTLTVTSLRCGHSYYTAGGSVSAHSYGAAVDIAAFNGQPVIGNQGPGSLTAKAIELLMQLEGEAQPSQLISLMDFGGPSFALSDHDDHLHMGYNFEASLGLGRSGEELGSVLFGGGSSQGLGQPDSGKTDPDQERKLSEQLGKIENPNVNEDVGDSSVTIEGESRGERRHADDLARRDQALSVTPVAAGAAVTAVDVPADARADEAYALGTVDGSARGWAKRQVVALAHRDGSWTTLGAPRDDRGRTANPALAALAVDRDGSGYAVGEKGAVVRLRDGKPPRLLDAATKADLGSIDLLAGGGAVATGPNGAVLVLDGDDQDVEKVSEGASLEAVTAAPGGGAYVAGSRQGGEPVLLQGAPGAGWDGVSLDLGVAPEAAVRLTSVAAQGERVLVGGAIADDATIGSSSELPFAALRSGGSWRSFCSVDPALVAVRELGSPSKRPCDGTLVSDGDVRGAASGVALLADGPVVASGDSLQVLESSDQGFRPVPAPSWTISSLGVASDGDGFVVGGDGRIARVGPGTGGGASREASPVTLPAAGVGEPATVAVAPGGDRALAFSGGSSSALSGADWRRGPAVGLGVRDAVWQSPELAWAIDETGALLALGDGEWRPVGYGWANPELRARLSAAAGGGPVSGPELTGLGLQAIAFRNPVEGYAVGGSGLVQRFDVEDGWNAEPSPTRASLADVAAGPGGVVAVGEKGTLLERAEGAWVRISEASELVAGADLTAADALADGTMLAAGGGVVLERGGDAPWHPADLPPLGQRVERIAGLRGGDGELHVVVLVEDRGARHLLEGTAAGWRAIAPPAGMTVSDFAPNPGERSLSALGTFEGRSAVAELAVGGAPTEAPAGSDADGRRSGETAGDERAARLSVLSYEPLSASVTSEGDARSKDRDGIGSAQVLHGGSTNQATDGGPSRRRDGGPTPKRGDPRG